VSDDWCWPEARLGEALSMLGRPLGGNRAAAHRAEGSDPGAVLHGMGLEAEPVRATYHAALDRLRTLGPAVLWIPGGTEERFLAVQGGDRGRVHLLGPSGDRHAVQPARVRALLCRPLVAAQEEGVSRLLRDMGIQDEAARERIRESMVSERLGQASILDGVELRVPPGAAVLTQARHAGLLSGLGVLLAAHAARQAAFVAAAWCAGRALLAGRPESGWLFAFTLLLLTTVPAALAAAWAESVLAIHGGALLRRRLLCGTTRLDPDEARGLGTGQVLGRVFEAETAETLALSGGFTALLSAMELAVAAWVLGRGAAGTGHPLLLGAWTIGLFVWAAYIYRVRADWTRARVQMSERLVEGMIGYRTRLANETEAGWHLLEDQDLETYGASSRSLDDALSIFEAVSVRGFLLAGLAVLATAVAGSLDVASVAISVGGIMLAAGALQNLASGLSDLLGASIAWRQVAVLSNAAARQSPAGAEGQNDVEPEPGRIVLTGRGVSLTYPGRSRPALERASFAIHQGERILVEGASGSGKSTLTAAIAGLRKADAGLLLLDGLDPHAWGEERWRRKVALAPQFHENHLIAGPLAFNLLLGRGWPPGAGDLEEAEAVCREMGLGALLDRMPGGLGQPVGEGGWQLSHGEKGRVFLARALLQRAEVVVLDESFGALDPETLLQALECARRRAPTLVVVSHP
jgi:ABC-type multidrug transport system fused ATPase/permease subunit